MLCLLLQNANYEAKFLYKRSPALLKQQQPASHFDQVWSVGKSLYRGDFTIALQQWMSYKWDGASNQILGLLAVLHERVVQRQLTRIKSSYRSISLEKATEMCNITQEKLSEGNFILYGSILRSLHCNLGGHFFSVVVQANGWQIDNGVLSVTTRWTDPISHSAVKSAQSSKFFHLPSDPVSDYRRDRFSLTNLMTD